MKSFSRGEAQEGSRLVKFPHANPHRPRKPLGQDLCQAGTPCPLPPSKKVHVGGHGEESPPKGVKRGATMSRAPRMSQDPYIFPITDFAGKLLHATPLIPKVGQRISQTAMESSYQARGNYLQGSQHGLPCLASLSRTSCKEELSLVDVLDILIFFFPGTRRKGAGVRGSRVL